MGQERYPLQAARTLRERELDEAREELARATRAVEDADEAVRSAQLRVDAHRRQTVEVRRREAERDAAGRSAAEMLGARDYLKRRRTEEDDLRGQVDDARTAAAEARRTMERARVALADARAAREAVERHHGKWQADRAKVAERRAEAEQDDLVGARRRRED